MRTVRSTTVCLGVVSALLVLGSAGPASAGHYWDCTSDTPWSYLPSSWAPIFFYNGAAAGDYRTLIYEEAFTDWNSWGPYTRAWLLAVQAPASTQALNVFVGSYGSTGWLGIAEIRRCSGCVILEGRVRLNRWYLDGTYVIPNQPYTRTQKKYVACQEIGHLLGLDHRSLFATGTCMSTFEGASAKPDEHDRDLVNSIYR